MFLGLGLHWFRFSLERNTQAHSSLNQEKDYQTIDTNPDDDYTRTVTYSQQGIHTFRISRTLFQFPVGIEYKFSKNKKWCLRFGSIFSYEKWVTDDALQITDAKPRTTITRYGSGSETVEIEDNEYQSTSTRQEEARSTTHFYYGLGYNPTSYLQIDLLGFLGTDKEIQLLDAEFYRSLRLSFTVKF